MKTTIKIELTAQDLFDFAYAKLGHPELSMNGQKVIVIGKEGQTEIRGTTIAVEVLFDLP